MIDFLMHIHIINYLPYESTKEDTLKNKINIQTSDSCVRILKCIFDHVTLFFFFKNIRSARGAKVHVAEGREVMLANQESIS